MSQRVLSNAEFAEKVNEGGASRRVSDLTEAPKTGVYVSTPDLERKKDGPVTADDAASHRDLIISTRGQHSAYQGGWTDDQRYLDHSINVENVPTAAALALRWKQKSVYDAGNDRYHSGFTAKPAPRSVMRIAHAQHQAFHEGKPK